MARKINNQSESEGNKEGEEKKKTYRIRWGRRKTVDRTFAFLVPVAWSQKTSPDSLNTEKYSGQDVGRF
jgi:hypothetical protein